MEKCLEVWVDISETEFEKYEDVYFDLNDTGILVAKGKTLVFFPYTSFRNVKITFDIDIVV
jgi:hypothetical protein